MSSLRQSFMGAFLSLLDILTDWLFGWWYGKSDKLPPITNSLLLESAVQLASKIRKKEVKSEEVLQAYINRARDVQPIINAVVDERFEEALEQARQVDEFISSGQKSEEELENEKPFLGVPFTCKESIASKGLYFTSGLVARKGTRADEDAAPVAEMKKAGAIMLAVTNVPELTFWWESSNNLYGCTRNPYDTSKIPGGSSGGEGALISSSGSIFGIGTDLGGSIRLPSFFNGIFGHKPTSGIVSNGGQFPQWEGEVDKYNCTGPMCRYATDLLPMLKVLAKPSLHQLKLDTKVDIRNLKVYYMEDDGGNSYLSPVHPDQREAHKMVIKKLQDAYGIKPENVFFKSFKSAFTMWNCKMSIAGGQSLSSLMTEGKGEISLPLELLKVCLRQCEHSVHVLFILFYFMFNPKPNSKECQEYVEMCNTLKKDLQELLGNDGVFLYPTQPTPLYLNQTMHRIQNLGYTSIFNVMGFPSTQCPLGLDRNGLPLGIQVVSNLNNDHLSIAVAVELEKLFGGWVNPSPVLHE